MILVFMPIVTKTGGIVPTEFNGFAVTSDKIIVVGDNTAVSGWKNKEKVFSFELPLKTDYALSVNQDDNVVIYTKNARFVFAQDGTPLTFSENNSIDIEELKNRKVITTDDGTSYVLTNRFAVLNTVTEVKNGEQTTVYTTPASVLFVEFAFWEGNFLLVVVFIAGLLDVRKRRFLVKKADSFSNSELTEKPGEQETTKAKAELPAFLKAFKKPEIANKGAAFSSEYSTKPGEKPRFSDATQKTDNNETTDSE